MGKLNADREVAYDFRTVEFEGVIWLFDNSVYHYICSATPNVWLEPIAPATDDDTDYWDGDGIYITVSTLNSLESRPVVVHDKYKHFLLNPKTPEFEAWGIARDFA